MKHVFSYSPQITSQYFIKIVQSTEFLSSWHSISALNAEIGKCHDKNYNTVLPGHGHIMERYCITIFVEGMT